MDFYFSKQHHFKFLTLLKTTFIILAAQIPSVENKKQTAKREKHV